MHRKVKVAAALAVTLASVMGVTFWYFNSRSADTLPIGRDPVLLLPMYNFSCNDFIQGFGQVRPDFYHGGFDFGVNDTTAIVSPCDAYVSFVQLNWYNEIGGHWQSNIELRLNDEWRISIAFESWALNDTYGALQGDKILVHKGQYAGANETLGFILCHGPSAHIDFSVLSYGTRVCPYYYFTEQAKSIFLYQFSIVNITNGWDM